MNFASSAKAVKKSKQGNVKTAKSSGLRKLLSLVVLAVPLAGIAGAGVVKMQGQTDSVIGLLNVTPAQNVLMQSCIDTHASRNVNFGEAVSTRQGCACASKLVSSVTPPAHYKAYAAVQSLAIEQYYWSFKTTVQADIDAEWESRVNASLKTLAESQKVNSKGLRHLFDYSLSAEQICDTPSSYESPSLESLAILMPLQTPIWEGDSEGVVEISLRGAEEPIRVSMNHVEMSLRGAQ